MFNFATYKLLHSTTAVWRLGFRPFFLLAALFALVAIAFWAWAFSGQHLIPSAFDPIIWHAHEMIYGYTTAVIAGFVLTASQNWTGTRGVHGTKLILLVALWLLGRILVSVHREMDLLVTLVDLSFYPLLGFFMFPYLRDPEMKVERVFFVYFALFFSGNVLVHLDALGIIHGFAYRGVLLGLNTTLLMVVFMGGRLIPFFTESSIARAQPRTWHWIEVLSHVSVWAFLLTQLFFPLSVLSAGIAFLTAPIHFVRLWGWQVRRVRRIPFVWILHTSYFWIVIGFLFTAFVSLGMIAQGPAVHAFTVGGLGGLTYGIMSRVSLGHTGRRLHPSAWTVMGYYFLNIAALVRVLGPILRPGSIFSFVWVSGILWSMAFSIFLLVYSKMLFSPRIDGKQG